MVYLRGVLAGLVSMLLVAAAAPVREAPVRAAPSGNLVLVNGRIFTLAKEPRWVTALLIRDGKVAVMGNDQEALAGAPPGTPVINLQGYIAFPAFHDARSRLGECGPAALVVTLAPGADAADMRRAVGDTLSSVPRGGWLVASDWNPRRAPAHRATLDSLSQSVPLWLRSPDGHASCLNSRALLALGLADDAPDPEGGRFERDAGGRLTGMAWGTASFQVTERWVNSATVEQVAAGIEKRIQAGLDQGIATFHDVSPYPRSAEAFALLARQGRLQARVVEMPMPQLPEGFGAWSRLALGDASRLALGPNHLVLDGTLLTGTAARSPGSPLWLGPERLDSLVAAAAASGRGVSIEAAGRAAVGAALTACERVAGPGWRGPVRFERAEQIGPGDAARLARLGGHWVVFPRYFPSAGLWTESEAAALDSLDYPLATLGRSLSRVAFGSDGAPGQCSPSLLMRHALGRTGDPLPAASCLNALTVHSARVIGLEGVSGSLQMGSRADLVVLDRDPLRVPPQGLPGTHVLLTVVGGEVRHRSSL